VKRQAMKGLYYLSRGYQKMNKESLKKNKLYIHSTGLGKRLSDNNFYIDAEQFNDEIVKIIYLKYDNGEIDKEVFHVHHDDNEIYSCSDEKSEHYNLLVKLLGGEWDTENRNGFISGDVFWRKTIRKNE